MSAFAPADHVTEREPGSGWEDCTFAALLETFRLALPNGRDIPATIAEVNRFRAAAGLPDAHKGATIEQTLPAARRLYGLTDDDYTVTTEWAAAERALRDPATVATVTGSMSAVPVYLRRWDPSFVGAHAVAARSQGAMSPTWCDPLAPKDGHYYGEPVTFATWRAFFTSLPGARAFVMKVNGGRNEMIAAGGIAITSDKVARVIAETPILDAPAGKRIATAKIGYRYPYLGAAEGFRAVLITTAIPYPDKIARPTVLYLASGAVAIEDAPPEPGAHTVTLTVDGKAEFTRTL